jgi:uncharacterized protein (TIGR00661 family)
MDWGLGHATRCIPVIMQFLAHGCRVTIAASGRPFDFLQQEFPELEIVHFTGFSPDYPSNGRMALKMAGLIPAFLYHLIKEKRTLNRLIRTLNIQIVVSDNRYGLWNRNIKSVLIIHQIHIKAPPILRFLEPILHFINRILINRFDECWIPDCPGNDNLGGELSHSRRLPSRAYYIGPLSRFPSLPENLPGKGLLVILSGPEPQRSILEEILGIALQSIPEDATIISGKTETPKETAVDGRIRKMSYASSSEVEMLMRNSALIICRPGYSTIMDLAVVGGKALFIPTPGQTEQEYLARYHKSLNTAWFSKQSEINLAKDIPAALSMNGFSPSASNLLLQKQIDLLLNK